MHAQLDVKVFLLQVINVLRKSIVRVSDCMRVRTNERYLFLIAERESDAFVAAWGCSSAFAIRDGCVRTVTPFVSGRIQKVTAFSDLIALVVASDGQSPQCRPRLIYSPAYTDRCLLLRW